MNPNPSLSLQGAVNFRDLGGYVAADGRRIACGRLFRSGNLAHLLPADLEQLSASSLTHVLDLRDRYETHQAPDRLWGDVLYECIPANPPHVLGADVFQLSSLVKDAKSADAFMCGLYRALPFDNVAYNQLVSWLPMANVQGILWHCALGKDRTGVASAILLMVLGVPRHTIVQDYLKTEKCLAAYREKMLPIWGHGASPEKRSAMNSLFSAKKQYIEVALDEILLRYGNFENYLSREFSLDKEALTLIRDRYLTVA